MFVYVLTYAICSEVITSLSTWFLLVLSDLQPHKLPQAKEGVQQDVEGVAQVGDGVEEE